MKCLFASMAALMLAAPSAVASPTPYAHPSEAIVLLECGNKSGTAVKIGPNQYITAAHVVDEAACTISGAPVTITRFDRASDYAEMIGPPSPYSVRVSCDGFAAEKIYLASGWALGNALITVPWLMTAAKDRVFVMGIGEAIPGMSGGALIDRRGRIVGIVNMRLASRSLPLSAAPVCS